MNNIEKLGFDNWFKDKIDLSKTAGFQIVRVISVNKNNFVVCNGEKDIYAELTGTFLFKIFLTHPAPHERGQTLQKHPLFSLKRIMKFN